jgi:hypothetical protein
MRWVHLTVTILLAAAALLFVLLSCRPEVCSDL